MKPRSLLFVPGDRPERFGKAVAAGADLTCIDLEDAVAPNQRAAARIAVSAFLAGGGQAGVRISAPDTRDGLRDLGWLADAPRPAFVMLAKAEDPAIPAMLRAALRLPLWAVIETPRGVRRVADVARAPGVAGLLFGAADYAAALGTTMDWEPMLAARGAIVAAAAEAGLAVLDVPEIRLGDEDALREGCRRARAIGFHGRACIHPNQIATVHAAYRPDEAMIARAEAIVAAFESGDGAAARWNGELLERPLVEAARRLLADVRSL